MRSRILFICLFVYAGAFAQARLVMNNSPFITFNGGTSGTPIYLVVENPATNAITLAGSGGNIISESEFNMIKWNIGTSTGTYIVPFTYAPGTKIPLTVNIGGAGTGAGNIKFSTYHGSTWNNFLYRPSDVTHTNDLATGSVNNSAYAIDRFWEIDANGYTSNANRPSLSQITFTYVDAEWSAFGNTITENSMLAQRFNNTTNQWGDFLGTAGTTNPVSNTTNSGAITPSNFFRSWTLSDAASPLPVVLQYFSGNCDAGTILLTWTTATESNNDHFTLERSFNGDAFETVSVIAGAGTSSSAHYYSTTDPGHFSGTAYYRLTQTDHNGISTSFPMIAVSSCEMGGLDEIVSAWNTDDVTSAWFSMDDATSGTLSLFDATGRKIFSSAYSFPQGLSEVKLNETLSAGVYFLTFDTGNKYLSRKFVVIR